MHACISTRLCGGLLVVGLLVLSSGCGGPERATVKGKVTLGDTPLTVGNVMFLGKDNLSASAAIGKDGTYVLSDAPVGEMQVTVTVPKLPPGGLEMMKRMKSGVKEGESVDPNDTSKRISIMGDIPENYVAIPDKYGTATTSGLTYSVKSGEQTYDIKLTP